MVGRGHKRKTNRESPRINANRIFLAFGCSAPADRLRRNRTLTGKMLGKNPRAGFSIVLILSFLFGVREVSSRSYFIRIIRIAEMPIMIAIAINTGNISS